MAGSAVLWQNPFLLLRLSTIHMPTALQIIQIGDEAGVILPDGVVAKWGLRAGDDVLLTPSGDSVVLEFIGKTPVEDVGEEAPGTQR